MLVRAMQGVWDLLLKIKSMEILENWILTNFSCVCYFDSNVSNCYIFPVDSLCSYFEGNLHQFNISVQFICYSCGVSNTLFVLVLYFSNPKKISETWLFNLSFSYQLCHFRNPTNKIIHYFYTCPLIFTFSIL
jgi:hypothetical protein